MWFLKRDGENSKFICEANTRKYFTWKLFVPKPFYKKKKKFYVETKEDSVILFFNFLKNKRKKENRWIGVLTVALKVYKEPFNRMYLSALGIDDSTKHTIETHWFLFTESPTNTNLFPLSLSRNDFASNLLNQ